MSALRIVADNTYDWELWLDPESRVNYVSPSCERAHGALPSRPGLEAALVEIQARRGELYDPEVVRACRAVVEAGTWTPGEAELRQLAAHDLGSSRCLPVIAAPPSPPDAPQITAS